MSFREYASLDVTVSLDVFQDISSGYHAMHNDPSAEDEVENEHVEAARAGDLDLFRGLDPKATQTLRDTLQTAFHDEIDEAIAEARL